MARKNREVGPGLMGTGEEAARPQVVVAPCTLTPRSGHGNPWGSPSLLTASPFLSYSAVFLSASKASDVLVRWKRAGSYLLEEIFEGNLEKECYEEICAYEEAREVFEVDETTVCTLTMNSHTF